MPQCLQDGRIFILSCVIGDDGPTGVVLSPGDEGYDPGACLLDEHGSRTRRVWLRSRYIVAAQRCDVCDARCAHAVGIVGSVPDPIYR